MSRTVRSTGPAQGEIVNLTDKRAESSRTAQLELLIDLGPDRIVAELAALSEEAPAQAMLPHLIMPAHHDVRSSDVFSRRLHGTLAAAAYSLDFPLIFRDAESAIKPWG